jgi:hypothetical protein
MLSDNFYPFPPFIVVYAQFKFPCQLGLPQILFVTGQVHGLCFVPKRLWKQVISNFPLRVNCFVLKMDHH